MISRQQALAGLREEELDVIVIGGGITGAGVALDAASRGYSVALIEREDFASGTSSRSSKLVHGGLRYLQSFDLGLVREALLERRMLVRMAPHLVRPLPLVVAAFEGARPDRMTGVGLNLYDVMSMERSQLRLRRRRKGSSKSSELAIEEPAQEERAEQLSQPAGESSGDEAEAAWSPQRHRQIDGAEALELLPALAGRPPTGGYLFYDCQTDDARLVQCVLAEADRWGAIVVNRVRAKELIEHGGRAVGVLAEDCLSGEELHLLAPNIVNATGVWADQLRSGELQEAAEVVRIRPSRGTHVIFDHADLPLVSGAIVPAGGQRTIFALPWLGSTLIGTTDNDYQGSLDHIAPDGAEIDYLLDAVNAFFARDLKRSDVAGAFAGVRPLISNADAKKSVDISRKAELYETSSGLITITGGKLTTWRRMARMTVDRLVEREAREAPCRTQEMRLGPEPEARPAALGSLDDAGYEHLRGRYGQVAPELFELLQERPQLSEPILLGRPDLLAEVVHAARNEQACTIGDVLLRRTRLGLLAPRELLVGHVEGEQSQQAAQRRRPWRLRSAAQPGNGPLQQVATLMGEELGWDKRRRQAEIEGFLAEAAAEGLIADRTLTAQPAGEGQ